MLENAFKLLFTGQKLKMSKNLKYWLKSPRLVIFFNESLPNHHYSTLVVYIKVF